MLAFGQFSAPQQELYSQLHAYACDAFKRAAEREMEHAWQEIPELHRTVVSVYAANAFGSVFWLGSRINHSCLPSLNFSFNLALQQETFHAIRDIKAGEELTIMYINGTNRTNHQRRAESAKWGFLCSCPACEDTLCGQAREEKRAELFALDQGLAIYAIPGTKKPYN